MLVDADYRRWVVRQVRDPFVKQFWEQEFENYDPRFMREAIAPIQNKVGALLQSPMLRNILGQIRNRAERDSQPRGCPKGEPAVRRRVRQRRGRWQQPPRRRTRALPARGG